MGQEKFIYYAFISYSHKDQKVAKRLQKRLEKRHLPSALQKSNPDIPKKLKPIFIDEENLVATGPLEKSLRDNLDQSKYLIVICSPNSAQSEYVNKEVQYFIDNGRAGQIIPLIIDGVANSEDPALECFPPAIRNLPADLIPLAINAVRFKEKGAFVRLVATMLELDTALYKYWDDRERLKRNIIYSCLAAVLAVVAGFFVWNNISHYHYYRSYVYKLGKPVGLFEVASEENRKKMEYTYRFTTFKGKVTEIRRINSAGTLVDPSIVTPLIELPMIKFVSDRVVEYYDLNGNKVYRKEYVKDMEAADFYCGDGNVHYALPADTFDFYRSGKDSPMFSYNQTTGSIRRITYKYDENGYVIQQMFRSDSYGGRDKLGTPAQDSKGRWGFSYTLDELGRVIGINNLDKNGKPVAVNGVYGELTDYGDTPYPVKASRIDEKGKLVLDTRGVAFDTVSYDKYFNAVSLSFFGTKGERVLSKEHNISQGVYTHDPETGFVTSVNYYDTDLKPCNHKDGSFSEKVTRDSQGRVIEGSYYAVDGTKTVCKYGYANYRYDYNKEGLLSSMTFFDVENKPTVDTENNVYGYRYSYQDGLLIQRDHLDSNGNLMLTKYGFASDIRTYDKRENKVDGFIYLDTNGNRTLTAWGYAEIRYIYEDGNIVERSYYDEEGKPVPDDSGVAKYINTWKNGKLISQKCFDEQDNPTLNSSGYSSVEYEYDSNGLTTWERYYDTNNQRIIVPFRYSGITYNYSAIQYTYDRSGNKTSETYYTADDKHAIQPNANYCYARKFVYNDNGTLKSVQFVKESDSQYQDMLNKQVEYLCYEYDNHGNQTKRFWLNGRGEKVDSEGNTDGYNTMEYEYDIYGNMIKRYWLGSNDKKIAERYDYDSFGNLTATYAIRFTGTKQEVFSQRKDYDSFGREIKIYYLDGENNLIIPSEKKFGNANYAIQKVQYDIFGNKTDEWYFDENEELIQVEHRLSHRVMTYDSKGNILTESFYMDENEYEPEELARVYFNDRESISPIKLTGIAHKIVRDYDALSHVKEIRLYDTEENLMQKENQGSTIVISYNSSGHIETVEAFDHEGKPCFDASMGACKFVLAYDSYGNRSDVWYFDKHNAPTRRIYEGKSREHHKKFVFDAMGKKLSEEIYDTEEKPDNIYNGLYKVELIYNSYGWVTEEIYHNIDENLSKKLVIEYDSDGKKINEEWEPLLSGK